MSPAGHPIFETLEPRRLLTVAMPHKVVPAAVENLGVIEVGANER